MNTVAWTNIYRERYGEEVRSKDFRDGAVLLATIDGLEHTPFYIVSVVVSDVVKIRYQGRDEEAALRACRDVISEHMTGKEKKDEQRD